MLLEQTQILCTVLNEKGFTTPYKTTHKNHPCTKWAGETYGNFLCLVERTECLINEYYFRYKKLHSCSKIVKSIKK